MPTLSPLAALAATLTNVCQQAQQHKSLLAKNEAATRAALIDPILRTLGWDLGNLSMVEPEKTITNVWRADYALSTQAGKLDLLIEAKCLGTDLEKYSTVQQLLSYAFGFGVLKVVITDGISWHFYTDFKPGNTLADNHFNLLQEPVSSCASQLVQWLDAAHFGHGIPAEPSVSAPTAGPLVYELKSSTKKLVTASPKKLAVDKGKEYQPLLPNLALPGQAPGKPTWLRLPNGQEYPIKSWRDILIKSAELVLLSCPNLALPIADRAGKKTSLILREKPKAGLSFTLTTYQGKPAFIYSNYSALSCLENALYILKLLPKTLQQTTAAVAFTV